MQGCLDDQIKETEALLAASKLAPEPTKQDTTQASSQSAAITATSSPTLGPEIVYVNPVPSPQVVNVTQTQPPAGPPPVIHVVVPSVGGDDGGADN